MNERQETNIGFFGLGKEVRTLFSFSSPMNYHLISFFLNIDMQSEAQVASNLMGGSG